MGILEQVTGLKERGASEDEIVQKLKEQGISPHEISEALGQAKIKNAVSSEQSEGNQKDENMKPSMMGPEKAEEGGAESLPTENISDENLEPPKPSKSKDNQQNAGFKRMTKEVSGDSPNESYPKEDYPPSSGSGLQPPTPSPNPSQEQYTPQYQDPGNYSQGYSQEYSPEYSQDYGDQSYYGTGGTDNTIEIAEQVFSEKIKDIQKQVNEFSEFKTLSEERIENISNRLKRIESNIDRLQSEILEKVGGYGRGIDNVKKEMGMMQESFGKVVNTLADKAEKKHGHSKSHSSSHAKHTTRSKKKSSSHKTKSKK